MLFDYDENGNLVALTPPGRPAHRFDYTAVDLQADYVPPDLGTGTTATSYSYSLDRELTQVLRPDGLIIDRNIYGERTFFGDNWPDRARHWLPVIDHPYDKATSEMVVTAQ